MHRTWRTAVPYENLDIQLGRQIRLDDESLFDKLIRRRRGGYCYEQNGGLQLLLRTAGFDTTMVAAAVQRAEQGNSAWGNHNAVLITIDGERWLADVGIGDGFLEPLPLRPGVHRRDGLDYRLEQLGVDTWRMHHHPGGSIRSYDFDTTPRTLADFRARSNKLSTAPDSPYVSTLIVGRTRASAATALLLSRTIRTLTPGSTARSTRRLESLDDFADALREEFQIPIEDLGPDAVPQLWSHAVHQDHLWSSGTPNRVVR